ncbi:hypothetical protein [Alteromonas australica]|uniref:Uncharacterized protein n=1 Tax=Alteromonas australica TaxID=589873 RepID=A0A075NZF2_9ALTE|nr:hypothetical protein [Alteromonas australica]AIF97990.1 hypothetical protein EP13_04360 [Alteromonas australica]
MFKDIAKLLKTALTIEKDTAQLNANIKSLVEELKYEREARIKLEHRITRLEAKEEAFNQVAAMLGSSQPNLPHHNGTSDSKTLPKG